MLKLASLARLKLSHEEAEHLSHEFESILQYVGEVKAVSGAATPRSAEQFPVRNVMREDVSTHESGAYSEVLLAAAPAREGQYVKVKKIL